VFTSGPIIHKITLTIFHRSRDVNMDAVKKHAVRVLASPLVWAKSSNRSCKNFPPSPWRIEGVEREGRNTRAEARYEGRAHTSLPWTFTTVCDRNTHLAEILQQLLTRHHFARIRYDTFATDHAARQMSCKAQVRWRLSELRCSAHHSPIYSTYLIFIVYCLGHFKLLA
jgi:hypothetical protein